MVCQAKKEDIAIIQSPVGMPARAVMTPYCISRALTEAVEGNVEDGLFFCGENAWRIEKITTVEEMMKEITEEAGL